MKLASFLFWKHNDSTNFSLFFLIEKREGLAFERLKFASSRPEHPRQKVRLT